MRCSLLPALLLFTGCAKLPSLPGAAELENYLPRLSFDSVDMKKVSWDGATADFVFNVTNPNPIEVKVASFTYDLNIAGSPLLSGNNDDGLALKNKSDTELRLPVAVLFADLISTASASKGLDAVPFTLAGEFAFDTPLGMPVTVPYEESGDLPVLRVPAVRLADARVAELKILQNSAKLEVDLGVTHDQASPLEFAKFDYALGLNGSEVASGLLDQLATVQPGKESVVTLPIDLNLLSLGTTVVTAITKKEKVTLDLGANLDVVTPLGKLPLSIDENGKLQLN